MTELAGLLKEPDTDRAWAWERKDRPMRRNRIYEATIDDRTMRVAAANQQTALDLLSNAFPDATIGLTTVKDGNGKPVLTTDAGILDDLPTHDDGDADGALEGLAGTAAEYVRRHRSERQSTQLTSRQTVTLTIIQNQCATGTGRDPIGHQHGAPAGDGRDRNHRAWS